MRLEAGSAEIEIKGLSADSREIAPGYLFAAIPGSKLDGRAFIPDAISRGAIAVLTAPGALSKPLPQDVARVIDANPRRSLARMAAAFYGQQPKILAAVTGTSGKTSVASFTRQIWSTLGHKATSLGTLGLEPNHESAPPSLTTPDPVALHRCLAAIAGEGFDHLVMEASSHGLDQYRLDGLRVTAACFTNLSREHLDYHVDMAAYLAAKLRLFSELLIDDGVAVINADVPEADSVRKICAQRGLNTIEFGEQGKDLRLVSVAPTTNGQRLEVEALGTRRSIFLPLVGAFQAWNVLAATGLAIASGEDPVEVLTAAAKLHGVPGRMEHVGRTPAGGDVYVDYAHKPDALEKVLAAVRPHTERYLVVVFGCGGDRDRGKRPIMGNIAVRLADQVIVTDDNPRSEDPAAIRREILAAAPGAEEIGERGVAIAKAVAALGPGDVLVIAGKGHETGQVVGGRVLPFDDRDVARTTISRLQGGAI